MKGINVHLIFLIFCQTINFSVQSSNKSTYAPDELNTTYDFYEKYFSPICAKNLTIQILDDKTISNNEFPTDGSFFSNILQFNQTLVNFTVHMAVVMGRPGLLIPKDIVFGQFTPNVSSTLSDLVDYFGQKWQLQENEIIYKSSITIDDTCQKIKSIYVNNLALLTGINTTEIVFISDNNPDHKDYSNSFIDGFYHHLQLDDLLLGDPVFSFSDFNNSVWNVDGKLPVTTYLPVDLSTNYFGFDIPYFCNKFTNWLDYSQADQNLVQNYTTLFYDVHTVFIENYKNSKFYTQNAELLLDLSENNIRTNLTLGYILSNSLYADAVMFGIPAISQFLPPQIINDFLNMHNFLKYEFFLYSDLHSYMIVSPFIEFMMSEFNLKINNRKNSTLYPANPRKMVWFTTHENNISALFKILNYDYRIKEIGGLLSIINTWNNNNTQGINNNFSYFPYIGYGYTVSFELLSVIDQKTGKTIFYIGMRDNLSTSYLFVISLRSFNKLAQLIMMVPSYSSDERNIFCN